VDPRKRALNLRKHGVAFEDAIQLFERPYLEGPDHRQDYGESRNQVIALVYTWRAADAALIADASWFRRAKIVLPEPKKAVSIRLDRDVMEWFRNQGKGYQTRINVVLRAYVQEQKPGGGRR
jgi:uncharacterized protein (DUF4415 family)